MRARQGSLLSLLAGAIGLIACGEQVTAPQSLNPPEYSVVGAVGNIVAWGSNGQGQLTGVPTGLFSAVSAGTYHTVAIRGDGTLYSWGADSHGQISATPAGTFKSVSAGYFHSVGLRTDGTIAAWGYDLYGQVSNTPSGNFLAVAAGGNHNVAILPNGTLFSWGDNQHGPISGTPAGTYTQVAAGDGWSAALSTTGTIVSWGLNNTNQGSSPAGTFVGLDAGNFHGVGRLANGTLSGWGANFWGENNMPGGTFIAASSGNFFTVAINSAGVLSGWGKNDLGQISVPAGVFSAVDAGLEHAAAITVIPYAPPAPPTNLGGVATGSVMSPNFSIAVTWTDGSNNETYFQLYRRTKTGNTYSVWTLINSPAANATSYNDTNLPQATYQYRIRACNSLGCSAVALSPLINAFNVPAAPSGLVATANSSTQMSLSWTDGSANETYFILHRRHKTAGVYGLYGLLPQPAANSTSATDNTVSALTTYQYRIRACNPAGCSAYAVSNQVITP